MSNHIVVSIKRFGYCRPRLTIVVEAHVSSALAGEKFIAAQVLAGYQKRRNGKFYNDTGTMRVKDYRVVDEKGLKRLYAAAKASVTIRRKMAAKKAAGTRAQNRRIEQLEKENHELRSKLTTAPTMPAPPSNRDAFDMVN